MPTWPMASSAKRSVSRWTAAYFSTCSRTRTCPFRWTAAARSSSASWACRSFSSCGWDIVQELRRRPVGASHRPGGAGDARSWWRRCVPGQGPASIAAKSIGRRGCLDTTSCGPTSSCAGAARTASAWSNRASSSATSEERFTRLVPRGDGRQPGAFYARMLLERSRGLLQEPALSVKEIGDRLGFKTSSHFIVAFQPRARRQRRLGVSPHLPLLPWLAG